MFKESDDPDELVLIEIGPRMTLTPVKYFEGTMGGQALFQNSEFITPQKLRGKGYQRFTTLKKRDELITKKRDKKRLMKEGQDEDGYLESAFV